MSRVSNYPFKKNYVKEAQNNGFDHWSSMSKNKQKT